MNTEFDFRETVLRTPCESDMGSIFEQANHQAAMDKHRHMAEKSIEAIPDDFDGCCIECGEKIDEERIRLVNTALCIDCKSELDRLQSIRSRQFSRL